LGQEPQPTWYENPTFKRTIAPATLITLGLLAFRDDGLLSRHEVRDWRNTYFPDFETELDDYTRYMPMVLTFGLNVAGVQGRSKLLRAVVNYVTSFTIGNISFTAGKRLTDVERPDGSSTTSFLSGHTTTAFVGAAFLHKEYGQKSSLYSIFGYSAASVTGVLRVLNDSHWLSDVLVSAGVGILSTEIGYILTDAVLGDWQTNPPPQQPADRPVSGVPSFLNFKLGYARQLGDLTERDDILSADDGWTAGFEGAYFFNPRIGLGGELSVAAFALDADNLQPPDDDIATIADGISTEPVASRSLFVGPFFSYPFASKWSLTAKATAGWAFGAQGQIGIELREEFVDEFGTPVVPIITFEGGDSFGFAAALGVRGMVSRRIGMSAFAEYNYSTPDYTVARITGIDPGGDVIWGDPETIESVRFDYFALGVVVYAMMW
jgi:hypothetical protein